MEARYDKVQKVGLPPSIRLAKGGREGGREAGREEIADRLTSGAPRSGCFPVWLGCEAATWGSGAPFCRNDSELFFYGVHNI